MTRKPRHTTPRRAGAAGRPGEPPPRGAGLGAGGTASALPVLLLTAGVVAAAAAVHAPALSAGALAFDDSQYLTENRLVRHPGWTSTWRFLSEVLEPSTVGGYYQPLTMISLMVDHALGGRPDRLRPFHRTSLALHAANTGLVVVLLYLLFGRAWPAAVAGLLFGLHPLTVEPIPWVGERKTLLAAFFSLLSLILYIRHTRRPSRGAWAGCLVAYGLALMSKPTSTPLPLVFLLLDYWPLRRLDRRRVVEKWPHLALGAAFAVITVVSQARTAHVTMPGEHAPGRIPLVLCHNAVFYLYKILWPARLSPHYPLPEPLGLSDPGILAGVIGTCLLLPALAISFRWTRALPVGWLIFFVLLLPTTGIIGFTIVIASDKYAYLPAIGLLMILCWGVGRLWDAAGRRHRPTLARAAIVATALALAAAESAATRRQITRWHDTEGLYRYMLSLAPDSPRLHTILGEILTDRGRLDEAADAHRQALRLRPEYPEALNNLGILLAQQEKLDEATRCFEESLRIWPDNPRAQSNLANLLVRRGHLPEAVVRYERSLQQMPRSSETHNNLASTLLQLGRVPEAMTHYAEAIRLDPDNAEAHHNLGVALRTQGRFAEAAAHYREALRVRPDHPGARQGLEAILNGRGATATAEDPP